MPNVGLADHTNGFGFGSQFRASSLSDSMNQLAERLAADGVIFEECNGELQIPYQAYYPEHYKDHSRRYKRSDGLMLRHCSTTALNNAGVVHVRSIK